MNTFKSKVSQFV